MKLCSIELCNGKHYCKGYCEKHYKRVIKYGDHTIVKKRSGYKTNHYLYTTYNMMKDRVNNPNSVYYKNYGGRGILICDRRLGVCGFDNFCKDMGERPEGHTLDRIDNNLGYNPENCKRSNVYEQSRNKRNSNTIVGVSYDKSKNKYVSYISVGRYIILGRFAIYEEAVEARKNAEIEYCIYL